MLIGKGKYVKQINNIAIHEIANGRYACWNKRTCLQEFDTLNQAETWCNETLRFLKLQNALCNIQIQYDTLYITLQSGDTKQILLSTLRLSESINVYPSTIALQE